MNGPDVAIPAWYPTGPARPELLAGAAKRLLEDAALMAYVTDSRLFQDLWVTANGVDVALQGAAIR